MPADRERTFSWQDPMIGAKSAQTMSGLDYLRAIGRGELPYPPIMATLGFDQKAPEIDRGKAMFFFEAKEYHFNTIGGVHGGVIATLLDSAVGCAVHSMLEAGVGYTTLELKVNFTRPIKLNTGPVQCEGTLLSMSRQVATAEGRLLDEQGKLYAHATTTCLVLRQNQS